MSSKKNIAKQIKKQILNNDFDYDYLYDELVDNSEDVLSGILNAYLYLFRNVDNICNEECLNNLNDLLYHYVRKNKNKKDLELVYKKIEVFLSNVSMSLDYEKLLKVEKYISILVNLQNKCIMNNMRRAKGDKYNFILYLIFEKRDIELLTRYIENNMKELLINNSTIPSIFTSVIERYIDIDEENEIEIKYFNRVINLFLKGRMYDKLIKDDSNYLKILKTSDKKFVLDLVEKIENEFYQTKEDVAKDYNVSFIIPKMEEYIYLPNGKIDLTKENIITIDNIVLNHYSDKSKSRGSYLPLLELSVKEDPNDDRNMHYLGREYMYYGKWNECIDTLIKHLNLKSSTWKDERCASMRFIARSYKKLGRVEESRMWYDKAINEAPYLRDSYVERGILEYELDNYKEASKYLNDALNINSHEKTYINEIFSWDNTIYDMLSICMFYLNRIDESLFYIDKAIDMEQNNERLINNKKIIKRYKENNNSI